MTPRLTDYANAAGLIQHMTGIETYLKGTNIDPALRHLVKMRVSQVNGCAYCMAMHAEEALRDGERVDRLSVLPAWQETDWFSDRERAALLWAETLTAISSRHVSDEIYAEVRAQFDEKDLADLTLLVIAINGWNRFAIPFQAAPKAFEVPMRESVAAD
jgi:AhpD family alkylhydroperoxidase